MAAVPVSVMLAIAIASGASLHSVQARAGPQGHDPAMRPDFEPIRASKPQPLPPPPALRKMGVGERLEILYDSQGCFHSTQRKLTFVDNKVLILDAQTDATYEVNITIKDKQKIDNYFEETARQNGMNDCTTIIKLRYTYYKDGKVTHNGLIVDGNCIHDPDKMLDLHTLIYRSEENGSP